MFMNSLTAPFLPQPPTSQNQPLTKNVIETPAYYFLVFQIKTYVIRKGRGSPRFPSNLDSPPNFLSQGDACFDARSITYLEH